MYKQEVLDHGFVILRNLAGPTRRSGDYDGQRPFDADDTDVANAARMSFEAMDQDRTYEIEMKLTEYLLKNHHDTPFEIIEVWLEVQLPIFVARQFVRQRTQTINEVSARYKTLPEVWYIPEIVGGKPTGSIKQGQQDNLPQEVQNAFKADLDRACRTDYATYKRYLELGAAPEHARMFLHMNHYTHWMQKMNLRNLFFSLLRLRWDGHAQVEAQAFAKVVFELLEPHLPGLMALYLKFFRGGATV